MIANNCTGADVAASLPQHHAPTPTATPTPCRTCGSPLRHTFVDLGMSPPCESFLPAGRLDEVEMFYPLRVMVCDGCWLVQLREYVSPEHIFDDYAYFSSYSTAWLDHASEYVEAVIPRLSLHGDSFVIELASNDGYLLRNFVERSIPNLGIEPAGNVAEAAEAVGVETLVRFFDDALAHELVTSGRRADLIIGNNVLAQVPDLNGFVMGMKTLLEPTGTITLEFPHLARLMAENQFDTIYHEHFSYFSLIACDALFARHGLRVYDIEELWTHGGSLRLWVRHVEHEALPVSDRVHELRRRERSLGLDTLAAYQSFDDQVRRTKRRLLEFLIAAANRGEKVVGYGAPGKGNTLLNYCGIREDLLEFVVDRNPYKHGRFLPGTHIPVHRVDALDAGRPDWVLILPWNLKREIMAQLSHIGEWGGRFVVPIPELAIYEADGTRAEEAGFPLTLSNLRSQSSSSRSHVPDCMTPNLTHASEVHQGVTL